VLILFFSVYLGWLPSSGWHGLHLLMPAFTLGWYFAPAPADHAVLDARGAGLGIRQAGAAQGVAEAMGRQARAQNALIPVITLAGISRRDDQRRRGGQAGLAWPGIGRLLYEGITFRDFPSLGVAIIGGAMIADQPVHRHPLRAYRSLSVWKDAMTAPRHPLPLPTRAARHLLATGVSLLIPVLILVLILRRRLRRRAGADDPQVGSLARRFSRPWRKAAAWPARAIMSDAMCCRG
jgi:hypothetical protein